MRALRPLMILVLAGALAAAAPAHGDWSWCIDADEIYVHIEDATIVVYHDLALYNCCPLEFTYDVSLAGDRIDVTEHEILEEACACLCCYNLSVRIEDVPPGEYTLFFAWDDTESGPAVVELPVSVPDLGQGASMPVAGPTLNSGCLESGAVPEEPYAEPPREGSGTWAQIKALFAPAP
jgi:hypothetical protein